MLSLYPSQVGGTSTSYPNAFQHSRKLLWRDRWCVPQSWRGRGKRSTAREARRQRHVCRRFIVNLNIWLNPLWREGELSPTYERVISTWSSGITNVVPPHYVIIDSASVLSCSMPPSWPLSWIQQCDRMCEDHAFRNGDVSPIGSLIIHRRYNLMLSIFFSLKSR